MKEVIKGGTALADPSWEDRHPTTFLYEKSEAIRWLEGRAKKRSRKRDASAAADRSETEQIQPTK